MVPYSLYFHIPFCKKRCGYCDFISTAGRESAIPKYVDAICQEIRLLGNSAPLPLEIHTLFFGGGTPSLLPISDIQQILDAVTKSFSVQPGCEISLEANPCTVTLEYLKGLFVSGINRLSLGMQSANPDDLRLLQRIHTHADLIYAVDSARTAGFTNINLDLIYGIPYQTLDRWQYSVDEALKLQPQHLSLYALTVEPGTKLHNQVANHSIPAPDDDLAADMYEWADQYLSKNNYTQYEISNWALNKSDGVFYACRHNLQYWHNLPYLGFGAAAHGSACQHRMANEPDMETYINFFINPENKLAFPFSPANKEINPIDRITEMQETMMVGLRLTREGVNKEMFQDRFNIPLDQVFGEKIKLLMQAKLVEWALENPDILRLTKYGRLLGNRVFREFVGDNERSPGL